MRIVSCQTTTIYSLRHPKGICQLASASDKVDRNRIIYTAHIKHAYSKQEIAEYSGMQYKHYQ